MGLQGRCDRQAEGACAQDCFAGCRRIRRRDLRDETATQPGEEFRQSIPEGLHRRQRRKLVAQHVLPACFECILVPLEITDLRDPNALEVAFLAENVEQDRWRGSCVGITVKVHNVVEISRPRALSKRADLLTECLFVGVGLHDDIPIWRVAVRMEYRNAHRRKDKEFVSREVELYSRPTAPPVGETGPR